MNDWPRSKPLETTRLSLEPLTVTHAPEMSGVLADSDLYRYIGGTPPTLRQLTERYARQAIGHSADGGQGWLNWIVRRRDTSAAIGFTQATLVRSHGSYDAEIAWVVAPQHQGHGFATEAAARMMGWLREQGAATVIAHIHPMNSASAKVARKLEMQPTERVLDGEVRWEKSLPRERGQRIRHTIGS